MFVSRVRALVLGKRQVSLLLESRRNVSAPMLRRRIKAIAAIGKVTRAMNLIASAKLRPLQQQLEIVRGFTEPMGKLWTVKTEDAVKALPEKPSRAMVVVTSDRGLCGSINSNISRRVRRELNEATAAGKPFSLIVCGRKGNSSLERHFARHFSLGITDMYKTRVMNFRQCLAMADLMIRTGFDQFDVLYTHFKNLVSFVMTVETQWSLKIAKKAAPSIETKYDLESDGYPNVLRNLHEFRFAVRLMHAFQESMTSEMASRMASMSNSSKAASDMLKNLTLQYNRLRQAKITTEITEIITGTMAQVAQKE